MRSQPATNGKLHSDQSSVFTERASGVVQRVDTVGREVCVLLSTGAAVVDVPLDCPVVLRGERVKLRMVQSGDHVRITYARRRGLLIGKLLEVQPERNCNSLST